MNDKIILVVEDESIVRRLVVRRLVQQGYTAIESEDPRQALLQVAQLKSLDLVVTDCMMPHMSGEEMVEKIRGRFPDVPVLFMSGYPGQSAAPKSDYLEKTSFKEEFLPKIYKLLGQDQANPSPAAPLTL